MEGIEEIEKKSFAGFQDLVKVATVSLVIRGKLEAMIIFLDLFLRYHYSSSNVMRVKESQEIIEFQV